MRPTHPPFRPSSVARLDPAPAAPPPPPAEEGHLGCPACAAPRRAGPPLRGGVDSLERWLDLSA